MEELTIWEQHTITLNKVSSIDSDCCVCVLSTLHGECLCHIAVVL